MQKAVTVIRGNGKRYLGELKEFKQGLPFGIINKRLTDVGGTFVAMNCPYNYIAVVPFRDLATSIELDKNNRYRVFKMYGGVSKKSFREYIGDSDIKKIVVTYDSLGKLIDWLEELSEDLKDYKVLVDEYHLILEDLDFREDAINIVLELVVRFPHYSFLSATPINTDFEFNFFKELPHYELDWGEIQKITPLKVKTPNVYKATVNLIEEFQAGLKLDTINGDIQEVKELHIFINSINGISQICQSANLKDEDVRIVCADRIRNNLLLDKFSIGSIADDNAKINFYTKKGFQGCNIFSNNALVVVVSDARRSHTLVDIETALVQIVGRIRVNEEFENVFRHKIYHIFSTNKRIMTDEEFDTFIGDMRDESEAVYVDLMGKDVKLRESYIKMMNFESNFLSVDGNVVYFNEKKSQLFRYKHNLKKSYKDGLTVRNAYSKSDRFVNTNQVYSRFDDIILKKIIDIKLEDLYKMFLEEKNREAYEVEYPEFFEYEQYLEVSEMNTARWNKQRIDKLLLDKKVMGFVHRNVSNLVIDFISSADLKVLYSKELAKVGSDIKPKASMIKENAFLEAKYVNKRIDGIPTKGYYINKFNN